ncbi:hypothetical protein [Methylibium sp.]|uniref:hypothetical protein n=1 Tax=Methylibium sp. TaxID=2067992 RepID=UPI0025DC6997|nr:hypothetical protein [Methylibium sp.]
MAAGSLAPGPAVVIAAHAERCPRCLARLYELEAIGGVLLEELEPAVLAPDALTRTLAHIDAPGRRAKPLAGKPSGRRGVAAQPARCHG